MSVALVTSVIIFLGIVYSGYLNGFMSSATTLLMLTVCMAVSVSYYGPLSSVPLWREMGGYAQPLAFIAVFLVSYFGLQLLVSVVAPSEPQISRAVDKMGGLAVSMVNGVLFTGFIGMFFYMLPWTGVHEGYHRFLGTNLTAPALERLTVMTRKGGGTVLDHKALFKRLAEAEGRRQCYRRLNNILPRLSDVYFNWEVFAPITEEKVLRAVIEGRLLRPGGASHGKGVGPKGVVCPHSGRPYVIRACDVPHRSKGKALQVYDSVPSHTLNGEPARMVLWTWQTRKGNLEGEVELMPESQFQLQGLP
jgi:hypothetical protein